MQITQVIAFLAVAINISVAVQPQPPAPPPPPVNPHIPGPVIEQLVASIL
jgi:hypothetical protein